MQPEPIPFAPTDADRLEAIEVRLARGSVRMDEFATELKRNTDATEDIREILQAARLGFKVIGGLGAVFKWVGTLAGAAVAIWGLIYALTHGGVPPK